MAYYEDLGSCDYFGPTDGQLLAVGWLDREHVISKGQVTPQFFESLARIVATGGVAAAIPATVLALYITYTPVGHVGPYAVQGRYHACALVSLFVIGVFTLRRRWPAHSRPSTVALACTLVALLAMAVTLRYAFVTIWHNYYV